jgi:hypothetical protein
MADQEVLQRFIATRPLAVMTRCIVDEMLREEAIESVFAIARGRNYTREASFTAICNAIADVVLEFVPSANKAYQQHAEELNVSATAFYNKLQNVEPQLAAALVRYSYQSSRQMLEQMEVPCWNYLRGYQTKIIDGNSVSACDNRIKELRATWQKALPGKSVVVLDADRQLIQDIHLLEDGQAQERTTLPAILETVQPKDLYFLDSAYCTISFMAGIASKSACFIVRQHGSLQGELLGDRIFCGRSETGKVYEQAIRVGGANGNIYRRVTIELFEPTRDGDTEIHLLTNLPPKHANALLVSDLYRLRWEIEHKFYVAQVAMRCEVKSLGYPRAALFVFCMSMLALNCRQVLFGALYQSFGEDIEEEASHYSVSLEISRSMDGFLVAIDEDAWRRLIPTSFAARMTWLIEVASNYDRRKHRKSVRGPKRPPPEKSKYRNGHHLSVKKILDKRRETDNAKTC